MTLVQNAPIPSIGSTLPDLGRWWLPVRGVDPTRVDPRFVHAAVTGWLDINDVEHLAQEKPYSVAPLGEGTYGLGIAMSTLTPEIGRRLVSAVGSGCEVRLGDQIGAVGAPTLLAGESWRGVSTPSGRRSWELRFLTPTTFRRRNRSSPLPQPVSVLRGLAGSWSRWSGEERRLEDRVVAEGVWVSGIEGVTVSVTLGSGQRRTTVCGFVGSVTFKAESQELADAVDGLFRLAPYSGVGSATARGLGVTELAESRDRQWNPLDRHGVGRDARTR